MSRETNTPQIPQVSTENLLEVVRTLKEIIEVREGRRGDELDEAVTYRDLVALGLVKKLNTGGYGDNTGTTDTPVVVPTDDSNVPPAPTNLKVSAVYNILALTWTVPSYRNHGVTEVWRATSDNLDAAVNIGSTAGAQFTDPPGDGGTYWYWVRNVSTAGVAGPYNSQHGTSATALSSVGDILKDIAADIENSPLVRDLRSRVEGLENGTFVPSYINDVVIRATDLARESKTLVSKVENNMAYVQQTMETAKGVAAKYTIKVGVDNHVAGFGLAAYSNQAGTATSEFIVAAEKFAIVPATTQSASAPTTNLYPGKVWVDSSVTPFVTKYYTGSAWSTDVQAAMVPFSVYTANTTVNGRTITPGVYMKGAFIEELQADKIVTGTLTAGISVTTGKLYGGQFTSPAWPTTSGGGFYLGQDSGGGSAPYVLAMGTKDYTESASTIVTGQYYKIVSVGTTNFVAVGAASNTVGVEFWATGSAPSGTGTVKLQSYIAIWSDGAMVAPGFSIIKGKLTISQLDVIDTLQVKSNAITVPTVDRYGDSSGTNLTGNGAFQTAAEVTFDLAQPGWVYVTYIGVHTYVGAVDCVTRLQIDSLTPLDTGGSAVQPVGIVTDAVYLAAGTHTATVSWYGQASNVVLHTRVLYAQGVMR